ncbi:hypothetical protein KI387_035915, partial [Taxus chinensis]
REEKMEGQTIIAEQGEHVEDGHEKKSMFHNVKDKVRKMNAKVKKNVRARQGHGENLEESGGEEEENDDQEEQHQVHRKFDENAEDVKTPRAQNDPHILNNKDDHNEGLFHSKETEQGKNATGNFVPSTERKETETDVGIPLSTEKAGMSETTPQDKVREVEEGNGLGSNTKPSNVTDEVKSGSFPSVSEEVESGRSGPSETGFGVMSKASGLAQGLKGMFSSKQSTDNDVKDTALQGECEGKENEGPQQQQTEAGGVDNAKENLKEIEGNSGPNSGENPEKEEVKSGTPATGPGFMKKASGLALGLKDIFPRNQSSNGNVKDTVLQGENKGKEEGGPQQQQSEAEAKAGQGYAQKLYAAKDVVTSKLGYGGQTNKENNGTRELNSADPIQVPTSGSGTEAMVDAKEGKKRPVVSKLSPGEDDKALSKVITEAVSNSAKSVKDTIVGGFYGGKGKSTATTETTTDSSQSPTKSTSPNASGGKGIVDRVTGVVGSFVGRKKGEDARISPSSQKQEPDSVAQVEKQMGELQ